MGTEPIALQIILMITSALGLILWGLVQFTLGIMNKRLTHIETHVQEFVTFRAVHDKTHDQIDTQIDDLQHKVDEHDDIIEVHEKKIEEHDVKINNLSEQIKQNKQPSTRRRNDKDNK